MRAPGRQRGVALITVLLVFALVAVIAAEMLRRNQLALSSVANLVDTRQAYYYALAGEAYARQVLAQQVLADRQQDRLTDTWAKTKDQPPFTIDHGQLKVEIHDLQGRFNLNNVRAASGEGLAQFQRLLGALGLNSRYAAEWRDWVDQDQQRSANGAEDADYSGYLTAGAMEADVSALRLLRSMQPGDYAKLAPHVAALPSDAIKVNVNTADAIVLRSLSPIISGSIAAQILARQQSTGYDNESAFQQATGTQLDDIAVASSYFEVVVTVSYDEHWQRLRTVLYRNNNGGKVTFTVISRERSPLIDDIQL